MISAITLIVTPFVVTGITALVKKIEKVQLSDYRISVLRFVVVALSFVSVLIGSLINGGHVDAASINTFSETFVVFLASTGVYLWNKNRKEKKNVPVDAIQE